MTAQTDSPPVSAQIPNSAIHAMALSATKTADGLIDPKLVLAWLLSAVGTPAYLVGLLVPVREAGALLPQLGLTPWIQGLRQRRWVWAAGSLIQGLAALGIAASVLWLDGTAAGWAVLGSLAILATARAACSASYKDVLARTIDKGRRGTIVGIAGSAAAGVVLLFAILVSFGLVPREVWAIACAVAAAGGLWILSAAIFTRLQEDEAEPTAGTALTDLTRPLRENAEFRAYIATRTLLIATALAPPFIVMLSQSDSGNQFGNLGALLAGSSAAAILPSYVWGRLSDRSSRKTLALSAASGTLALGAAALTGFMTGTLGPSWMAALFVFAAQIGYHGVRAGRSTHLTDMDTRDRKPLYTALSNTMIGVLLLAGGAFGLVADLAGPAVVLAIFAGLCALAIIPALRLSELQDDG